MLANRCEPSPFANPARVFGKRRQALLVSARVANREIRVIEIKILKAEGGVENPTANPSQIQQEIRECLLCTCAPLNFMGVGGARLQKLADEPNPSNASARCKLPGRSLRLAIAARL